MEQKCPHEKSRSAYTPRRSGGDAKEEKSFRAPNKRRFLHACPPAPRRADGRDGGGGGGDRAAAAPRRKEIERLEKGCLHVIPRGTGGRAENLSVSLGSRVSEAAKRRRRRRGLDICMPPPLRKVEKGHT